MLLKQPNSLEVDRAELRKTKSAEAMSMAGFLAPTIVIGNYCLRHNFIVSASIADNFLSPENVSPSGTPPAISTNNFRGEKHLR